jgi:t-SNARE complex subunit (syntaxin)
MQEKIVRSAEIVLGKRLDADEKEQVLMDPGQVQKIYEDKLKAGAHVQLQNAVADIEERHRDIQKLEKVI